MTLTEQALSSETERPSSIRIDLSIDEPEVVAALYALPEGRERNNLIRTALRIGVAALQQAQGQIDAEAIQREGDRLLTNLASHLAEHKQVTEMNLATTLREYFDPQSGRLNVRLEGLVKQDGELERLMRGQIEKAEQVVTDALLRHVGENSDLMRLLNPDDSNRLLAALRVNVEAAMQKQNETVLAEFSLNNQNGALARLVRELNEKHLLMSGAFEKHLGEVVSEFSLDNEQSALSRLVRRVEDAQNKISAEFSLDSDNSALARMRRDLMATLDGFALANSEFQMRVMAELEGMKAKKKAEAASTTHGHEFETKCLAILQEISTHSGDVFEETGNTTGFIPRSKVGDSVITLGADNAAAGARIVIETKEDASYTLKSTLEEIATARQNREASVGLFVHSKRTAPSGTPPLARHGNDLIVLWDVEDESTDIWLKAALMTAKALAFRIKTEGGAQEIDFVVIDKAIQEIERQIAYLDDIKTWTATVQSNAVKVIDRTERMQKALLGAMEDLKTQIEVLPR